MNLAIYCRRIPDRRFFSLRFLSFLLLSLIVLNAVGQSSGKDGFVYLRMNEVNAHAARHFLTNFSPSTPVKWIREDHYYVASFGTGNSTVRAYYKNNVNFDYCIKHYLADDLDRDLRSAVLNKFPGCKIMIVTELTNLEKQAFFINIKDGAYIKTLRCTDEGMEVTEKIEESGF
jgi:hypothetical protein